MNIILIEDSRYDIGSFLKKLEAKYPTSSRMTLNSNNYLTAMKSLNTRPLLTKEWLVIIGQDVPIKIVGSIFCDSKNINVLLLQSTKNLENIEVDLHASGANFKVLNNLKPPKHEILNYVMSKLDISLADAKYICSRHKYYVPAIVNSVYVLSTFDIVNRDVIKYYTKRFGSASFYNITESLLGVCSLSKKKVIELVYNYRYGFDYLLKFLKKDLAHYRLIFELVGEGLLTLDNYRTINLEDDSRADQYKRMKPYQIKNILENYSKVSVEYLYFVESVVSSIKPRYTEIYKLIVLLN